MFLLLARKASALRRGVVLFGWLFQTARYTAKNARLQAQRRTAHEQKAARKRVTRALEKMRHFFGRNEVIAPGVFLAVLLSAHAAKAAPAYLTGDAAHILAGSVPVPVSLITEGVLHAMKIAKLKLAVGVAAAALAGAGLYTVAQATKESLRYISAQYGQENVKLENVYNADRSHSFSPVQKDATRNVLLVGKVRYENGKPARGVILGAQLQNNATESLFAASRKMGGTPAGGYIRLSKQEQEVT